MISINFKSRLIFYAYIEKMNKKYKNENVR